MSIYKKVSGIIIAIFTLACLYFMSLGKVGIVAAYGLIGFNIVRVFLEIMLAKKISDKLRISDKVKEEIPRKTAHILVCLITLPMIYYSFKGTIHLLLFPLIVGVTIIFGLSKSGFAQDNFSRNDGKPADTMMFSLVGGFIINVIIALIYPKYTIGVLLGVVALGLGDPMACFIGKTMGKHKLPNGKSVEGFIGFIIGAMLTMFLFTYITPWKLLVIAIAGAITELYSGDYDNILIQIVVAVMAVIII